MTVEDAFGPLVTTDHCCSYWSVNRPRANCPETERRGDALRERPPCPAIRACQRYLPVAERSLADVCMVLLHSPCF
jgi:hypothetical protein